MKNNKNKFTVRIGNRLYANKYLLDKYLEQSCKNNRSIN